MVMEGNGAGPGMERMSSRRLLAVAAIELGFRQFFTVSFEVGDFTNLALKTTANARCT